jgi:hypothetical protein
MDALGQQGVAEGVEGVVVVGVEVVGPPHLGSVVGVDLDDAPSLDPEVPVADGRLADEQAALGTPGESFLTLRGGLGDAEQPDDLAVVPLGVLAQGVLLDVEREPLPLLLTTAHPSQSHVPLHESSPVVASGRWR